MATKKPTALQEDEILTAAADESTNEYSLHQTESKSEKDEVFSTEGTPNGLDTTDIHQTDFQPMNPEGIPIEDAVCDAPEDLLPQTEPDSEKSVSDRFRYGRERA